MDIESSERTVVFFDRSYGGNATEELESYGIQVEESYTGLNAAIVTGADARELATLQLAGVVSDYAEDHEVTISDETRGPYNEGTHGPGSISPDPYDTGDQPEARDVPNDWGYLRVRSAQANAKGLDGADVKVAIFDTGIDADHEYLKDNYAGFTDLPYGKPDPYDDHGHGTHCGGIVKTVAPKVELYGYKLHMSHGANRISDILRGLDTIVQDGMDVVNMSFGLDTDEEREGYSKEEGDRILNEACSRAYDSGVFLVAAAGNDGQAADPTSGRSRSAPASGPDVFAVGAMSKYNDKLAYFTNLGFDISAPGARILSSIPGDRYATWDGTSMACPFVVGAVAAVKSKYSDLTNDEIKDVLIASADDASHNTYYHGLQEYKVLNLEAAADLLEDTE
jgi:subtilisin family serine protease